MASNEEGASAHPVTPQASFQGNDNNWEDQERADLLPPAGETSMMVPPDENDEVDALMVAIQEENREELRALMRTTTTTNCSSDSNIINQCLPGTSYTPLFFAIISSSRFVSIDEYENMSNTLLPIIKCLVQDCGADINQGDLFHGITPLLAACNRSVRHPDKFLPVVQWMMHEGGANRHAISSDGKTLLLHMAKVGHISMVQTLLKDPSMDVTVYDQQAMNALIHSCTGGHVAVARLLLDHDPTLVNAYKVDTPMWYACAHGQTAVVQLLIQRGGLIEYRQDGTIYSTTPLMEACEWGHYDVVSLLLEEGANPCNETGHKAMALADSCGYIDVVQLLRLWQRRLLAIEAFLVTTTIQKGSSYQTSAATCDDNEGSIVPPKLLPHMLSLTSKRRDLIFRILRQRGDILLDACCYCDRNKGDESRKLALSSASLR